MVRIFNSKTNHVKAYTKINRSKLKEEVWMHELFNNSLEHKKLLFLCGTSQAAQAKNNLNDNRINEIIKDVIGLGYEVYCVVRGWGDEQSYIKSLYDAGVKKVLSANNDEVFQQHIEDIATKNQIFFSAVMIDFYKTYYEFHKSIECAFPNVKVIIDGSDVNWLRATNDGQECIETFETEMNQEVFAYNNANVVFAENEGGKAEIIKACPGANVKILPSIWPIKEDSTTPTARVKEVVFIDVCGKDKSHEAAQRAIKTFNKFIQRYPCFSNSTLHLVTQEDKVDLNSNSQANIKIYKKASQDLLKELYECCCVALLPFTCGSSVNKVVCEAISNRIPVITTPIGAHGLDLVDGVDSFVSSETEKQVHSLYKIFTADKESYNRITKSAIRKLERIVGTEARNLVLTGTLSIKPITVSIVTYNNEYLLRRCLDSILLNTRYPDYKIHVTSNACKDGTRQVMQLYTSKHKNITYQYNEENKYFIKAHNEAISFFPNDDMILLNEDIEVVSSCWISDLYSAAYSAGYVGCAGGKMLYPNGTICEAGAQLFNDGSGINIGRHQDQKTSNYNYTRYVGYVSGCLMYMRRDCIDKFGPLDASYYPCYYEDSDWQYNLHLNGYKTVYSPRVVAIHREGSSCGTDPDNEKSFKRFMKVNKTKFLEKYKSVNIEKYNS